MDTLFRALKVKIITLVLLSVLCVAAVFGLISQIAAAISSVLTIIFTIILAVRIYKKDTNKEVAQEMELISLRKKNNELRRNLDALLIVLEPKSVADDELHEIVTVYKRTIH